jgi:hydrogenase expression/formation protein HypE
LRVISETSEGKVPDFLPVGKLEMDYLGQILSRYAQVNERVVVGAEVGEDATVIDFGDRYLVAKTDPITFATEEIGWYAVNVNANDVAATAAIPRWFLATLLLPAGSTDRALVDGIFSQLSDACRQLGISLCGGHTEITYGLARPIVVGQMLGEVERDRLVTTAGAQVGDDIILTKGIAIEATCIIAREKAGELASKYPADFIAHCQDFLHDPGISVVREAQIATAQTRVHAMHDPTEGGLAMGLRELAQAAEVGLLVNQERIEVLPETTLLCTDYGLDPLGIIASGSLLIVLSPKDSGRVIEKLAEAGIAAAVIGQVVAREEGLKLTAGGVIKELPYFERDEIAKLFE